MARRVSIAEAQRAKRRVEAPSGDGASSRSGTWRLWRAGGDGAGTPLAHTIRDVAFVDTGADHADVSASTFSRTWKT